MNIPNSLRRMLPYVFTVAATVLVMNWLGGPGRDAKTYVANALAGGSGSATQRSAYYRGLDLLRYEQLAFVLAAQNEFRKAARMNPASDYGRKAAAAEAECDRAQRAMRGLR